ncbi:MAG: hypothetical protein KAV82_08210 [Phycisphaerae bacterium]|nr:hypothetical protein [Phycisphaerae bacterium]
MLPVKRIGGFFLWLLLCYVVLVIPWLGLPQAYAAAYRAVGNTVFGSFGRDTMARFRPLSDGKGMMDTEITLRNRWSDAVVRIPCDSRLTGYLATAEVIALILATPIPWSRRWKALLWGFLLVSMFVALRTGLILLYWLSSDSPLRLYELSPFWSRVLIYIFQITVVSPTLTFIMPVFIWVVATFRRGDLERWMGNITTVFSSDHPQRLAATRRGARRRGA